MIIGLFLVCILFFMFYSNTRNNIDSIKKDIELLTSKIEHLNKEVAKIKHIEPIKPYEENLSVQQDIVQEKIDTNEEIISSSTNKYQEEKHEETGVLQTQYEEDIKDDDVEYIEDIDNYIEEEKFSLVKKSDDNSFEKMFLGNIFNIIGAVAIILGCGFFITLISPILPPIVKVAMGFLCGIAMIIGSKKIKKPSMARYSEILAGTGFSVLFITVFCMSTIFDTFNTTVSSLIGGVILIFAYIFADNNKTASMPAIAMVGGYLNIIFASGHVSTPYIFGYLIFLNILSAIFVYRNPSKSLINLVNLILTLLYLSIFRYSDLQSAGIVYPLLLWGVYILSGLKEKKDYPVISDILHWMNIGVLFIFSSLIFNFAKTDIGFFLLCISIAYTLITGYAIFINSTKIKMYVHSMLLCILCSTLLLASGIPLVITLSVEAMIFGYLIKAYKYDYLVNWISVYIITAIISLFFIPEVIYNADSESYKFLFNKRTLGFIFPTIASSFGYYLFNKSENKQIYDLSQIFKFSFISLIYIGLTLELNNDISYIMKGMDVQCNLFIKNMTYSIIASIYSINMYRLSKNTKLQLFNAGSMLSFYVALILLCFGHTYYPINSFIPVFNIRFIAYLTAISAAVFYAQKEKSDIYKYIAVIIGFALIHFEIKDIVNAFYVGEYLISMLWVLYAGIVTGVGIAYNKKYLKLSGIWLCILSVIRIFIYDLATVDIIYKLISFITLGIMFMCISYYYNKKEK